MLTKEDVIEKLRSGELTPQDIAANGWMCSVTQRISKIKQPRGGYIKPKEFEQISLDGGSIDDLHPEENVSPGLVGIAVDYLTRFMSGTRPKRRLRFPSWALMLSDSGDCSSSCCRMCMDWTTIPL